MFHFYRQDFTIWTIEMDHPPRRGKPFNLITFIKFHSRWWRILIYLQENKNIALEIVKVYLRRKGVAGRLNHARISGQCPMNIWIWEPMSMRAYEYESIWIWEPHDARILREPGRTYSVEWSKHRVVGNRCSQWEVPIGNTFNGC